MGRTGNFLVLCCILMSFSKTYSFHFKFEGLLESTVKGIDNDSLKNADDNKFTKKYNSLVSRAYFRIIVEAERADIRLGNEYMRLFEKYAEDMDNESVQTKFTLVYTRFLTHRRMLSGLKSWRIFSEQRTGDIDYFKAENFSNIYEMYRKGATDEKMIVFLIYKLADLYHFEG